VSLSTPLIVNAALTGMVPQQADNASVPVLPEEIAADAERCRAAGASIVHLHARETDGAPAYRRELYAEIIARVRERCPDVIVCVSTSGRTFRSFEQRADVLELDGDARPELASLTLGSLNFPTQASVNEPATIRALAERMAERGIVPELELFDLGMADYLRYLLQRNVLRPPLYGNERRARRAPRLGRPGPRAAGGDTGRSAPADRSRAAARSRLTACRNGE
jgi:3-keto-5-aminohexanoate cleavage enzyme